jgi:Uma2 family endonuclease
MPVAILETPPRPVPPDPPRKLWSRSECAGLQAAGVLDYRRLELIEGELISRRGKNRPHSNSLTLLRIWLTEVFGPLFVQQETPIDVAAEDNATNEPEPDLIVLARPFTDFREDNPQPADVRLAVEIADTTLAFDRSVKARLYARAGVAEYWILDIVKRQLLVHRNPRLGEYLSVNAYGEQEVISPLAAPSSALAVHRAFLE